MTSPSAGPLLIVVGLGIALIGLLVWSGWLSWFGRLPGDIRIERDSVRIYIPLVSMLLVSVVLSLIMYVINRLFWPSR
jgi:di/tricarboxylate transporter